MQKREITVTLLNRKSVYTGCLQSHWIWKSSFWVDSSLHLWHNQNGLRRPTDSAGFQTHCYGFGPWVRKPCLLLVQLPPSTLETSGTFPGKSQHLPTVLGGSRQQPNMQLLLCAATWCNLSHTQKLKCEATIGGGCTLGRMACMLSERMP